MKRLIYMAALALIATLMLAPGATAQQMNGEHRMPNGQMMDDSMMASPTASASASPSATPTGSATPTASTSATASAPRNHHHGGGASSASAAVGGRLPSTGGVPSVALVSVGALALLIGFGLIAYRLLRRST